MSKALESTTTRRTFLALAAPAALAPAVSVPAFLSVVSTQPEVSPELIELGCELRTANADYRAANVALNRFRAAIAEFKKTDPLPEPYHAEHISTCTRANDQAFDDECRAWSQRVSAAVPGDSAALTTTQKRAREHLDECVQEVGNFDALNIADLTFKARLTFLQPRGAVCIEQCIVVDLISMAERAADVASGSAEGGAA